MQATRPSALWVGKRQDVGGSHDARVKVEGDHPVDNIARRKHADGNRGALPRLGDHDLVDVPLAHHPACIGDSRIAIHAHGIHGIHRASLVRRFVRFFPLFAQLRAAHPLPESLSIAFTIAAGILALGASAHAVIYKRESRSASIWVILLWVLTALGFLLYVLLGVNRVQRRASRMRRRT